jgi:hypothetical protein
MLHSLRRCICIDFSKTKKIVAIVTVHAKYNAIAEATKEAI